MCAFDPLDYNRLPAQIEIGVIGAGFPQDRFSVPLRQKAIGIESPIEQRCNKSILSLRLSDPIDPDMLIAVSRSQHWSCRNMRLGFKSDPHDMPLIM